MFLLFCASHVYSPPRPLDVQPFALPYNLVAASIDAWFQNYDF